MFGWLKKKAKAELHETELRLVALEHAAAAHCGRMHRDIVDAADAYYNFLKGNKNNDTGSGN